MPLRYDSTADVSFLRDSSDQMLAQFRAANAVMQVAMAVGAGGGRVIWRVLSDSSRHAGPRRIRHSRWVGAGAIPRHLRPSRRSWRTSESTACSPASSSTCTPSLEGSSHRLCCMTLDELGHNIVINMDLQLRENTKNKQWCRTTHTCIT